MAVQPAPTPDGVPPATIQRPEPQWHALELVRDMSPPSLFMTITSAALNLAAVNTAKAEGRSEVTYRYPSSFAPGAFDDLTDTQPLSSITEADRQEMIAGLAEEVARDPRGVAELIRTDPSYGPWVAAINQARRTDPDIAGVFRTPAASAITAALAGGIGKSAADSR